MLANKQKAKSFIPFIALLGAIIFAAIIPSFIIRPFAAQLINPEGTSLTIDFSDAGDLNDFSEFSNADQKAHWGNEAVAPANTKWAIDTAAGHLIRDNRAGNDVLNGEFKSFNANLVYTGATFDNFEIEITYAIAYDKTAATPADPGYNYIGGQYNWFAVGIGQKYPGQLPAMDFAPNSNSALFIYGWDGSQYANVIHQNSSGANATNSCDDQTGRATGVWGYRTFNTAILKVVGKTVTMTSVNPSGENNVSTFTLNENNPKSYISINSLNQYHWIDSVKITRLDESGNAMQFMIPVDNVIVAPENKTIAMNIGEVKNDVVSATVLPADAGNTGLTFASDNENVIKIFGNTRYVAVGSGTATITATSHNGKTDTATVTVAGNTPSFNYQFANEEEINKFEHYYLDNGVTGSKLTELDNVISVAGGGLARTGSPGNTIGKNGGWSEQYLASYFKLPKIKNFEISAAIKFSSVTDGWAGFVFGQDDKAKGGTQDATGCIGIFSAGAGTLLWGSASTSPSDVSIIGKPGFELVNLNEWNTLRIKAYGNTVELYLNGVKNDEKNATLNSGYIGLISTNIPAVFDDVNLTILTDTGEKAAITEPTTLSFNKTDITATPSDDVSLILTEGTQNVTYGNILFTESNSNIATYNRTEGKLIFFGGIGTCTIKAFYEFYPEISATVSVTVAIAPTTLSVNKPQITVQKTSATEVPEAQEIVLTEGTLNVTDGTIVWSSTDNTIAYYEDGKIVFTGKAGSCTITAKYENYADIKCDISVVVKDPSGEDCDGCGGGTAAAGLISVAFAALFFLIKKR